MSTLKVYDMNGAATGDFELAEDLVRPGKGRQAVRDTVVAVRAHRRAGTASTLRKGEVAGSNRKPWRQKGTGRARAGYRQSPVWRGGGVAFGPHPRAYGGKVNRKVRRLAFRRAVGDKLAGDEVKLVEDLVLPEGRTKQFLSLLKALGITLPALFVLDRMEENVRRAARNVAGVKVVLAADVDVYDVLRYPVMVVNRAGMQVLLARLGAGAEGAA